MQRLLVYVCVSLTGLSANVLFGQSAGDTASVQWYYTGAPEVWDQPDTSLHRFEAYNVSFYSPWQQGMGTPVGLSIPLELSVATHQDFYSGWGQYDPYLRSWEQIRQYVHPRPYTDLYYVQGSQGEQHLRAIHSRRLGRYLHAAADYSIYAANGFYSRQRAKAENFDVSLRYAPEGKAYAIAGGYLSNSVDHQMNGGIDTAAIQPEDALLQTRKNFVPVNLAGASTEFNRKTGWLQQRWKWDKTIRQPVGEDSFRTISKPLLTIVHQARFTRERYAYTDPAPDNEFYPALLLRLDSTKDESILHRFKNEAGISTYTPGQKDSSMFNVRAFMGYDRLMWQQQGRKYWYHNWHVRGEVLVKDPQRHRWEIAGRGQYFLSGYNGGDYEIAGSGWWQWQDWMRVNAGLQFIRQTAPLVYQQYLGNHYYWDVTLSPQYSQHLTAGVQILPSKTSLQVTTGLYDNYFYFDANRQPAQWNPGQAVLSVRLEQPVHWGHFNMRNALIFQQVPSEGVLRLPTWLLRHSVYYDGRWFNQGIPVQIGITMRYYSSFRPYAFAPALGQFYLSEGVQPLATYPVFDLFFNMNVQGARLFFKIQHANQGLSFSPGYFATYTYPAADRSFHFGVSWRFYD